MPGLSQPVHQLTRPPESIASTVNKGAKLGENAHLFQIYCHFFWHCRTPLTSVSSIWPPLQSSISHKFLPLSHPYSPVCVEAWVGQLLKRCQISGVSACFAVSPVSDRGAGGWLPNLCLYSLVEADWGARWNPGMWVIVGSTAPYTCTSPLRGSGVSTL